MKGNSVPDRRHRRRSLPGAGGGGVPRGSHPRPDRQRDCCAGSHSFRICRKDEVARETWIFDKHSIGGIPGSRITMILVPLIPVASGFLPEGFLASDHFGCTDADAMETLARVDLSVADVQRVVDQARGCVRLERSAKPLRRG